MVGMNHDQESCSVLNSESSTDSYADVKLQSCRTNDGQHFEQLQTKLVVLLHSIWKQMFLSSVVVLIFHSRTAKDLTVSSFICEASVVSAFQVCEKV